MRPIPSSDPQLSVAIIPLFRELGDLKRICSADREGSIATRLFLGSWDGLITGQSPHAVMAATVSAALAASRLGDLDYSKLVSLGLTPTETGEVLERAFDDVTAVVDRELRDQLRRQLLMPSRPNVDQPIARPACLELLARQPRAGVTNPGQPRLLLLPQETHAEHCVMVAIYGALLAPHFHADPALVFLAGLAHHLHNATMPDSGFSGEMLVGSHLATMIQRARDAALEQFREPLMGYIMSAVSQIDDTGTSVGCAFHAADVLDRVLEIEQHFKMKTLSMRQVLDDYGLVHAGPVKHFHDRILRDVGLL